MRVLVFGASITHGLWDTEGGWVQQLRNHYDSLQIQDFSISQPDVFNLGISGDTTTDVLRRFKHETEARARKRQKVAIIFAIGTNNALKEGGKFWSTPEAYKVELESLISQARGFSQKVLFVGLTPCDESRTMPVSWGDFNYTNGRIWLMEQTMRAVCAGHDLPHVPIFETFQAKAKQQELLSDGLHPNNVGHELMANLIRPELDRLFNPS